MPGTEHGPLHDLCWPYHSIWYSQSLGSLENYGKVWLSNQVHSNGEAVPRWYACMGPTWWWVFWSIPCDKWCQARLCTNPNCVQQWCSLPCLQLLSRMVTMVYLLGIALMESFSPKKVACQIQDADRGARWVPLCWWHGSGYSNRREDAKRCRSSIWLLWQLWPHNRHQKDRGGLTLLRLLIQLQDTLTIY